jgi:hypothetical protein
MIGLLLVCNFADAILPNDSLHYLSLHAHIGIAGWFLMLVIGVGSRLIPMFLISKYSDSKRLWLIYFLLNGGLISFIIIFLFFFTSFSLPHTHCRGIISPCFVCIVLSKSFSATDSQTSG